uniref:Uncharacterized protein n=1 Tax=Geobacter metallireducens TaxID=28232 RepID=A0A831UJF9_GEOME
MPHTAHAQQQPGQAEGAALIREVLADGRTHAVEMQRHALETAAAFRSGGERRALGHYIDFLNGFDSLVQALDYVGRALGIDFASTSLGDKSITRFAADLNILLAETMKAQERKDWVLLADLLEYELAPHLESWQQVFAVLGERVPAS